LSAAITFTPNPAIGVSTSVERIMPVHKLRGSAARRDPGGGGINVQQYRHDESYEGAFARRTGGDGALHIRPVNISDR
jgi:hypothetical protein